MTNEKCSKKSKTASLDRIDNNLGYTINNIQWVHKDINRIKREYDQNVFLTYVKYIYDFKIKNET